MPDPRPPAWRLADAASAFLRRHADDAVPWRPWGEDAHAEARRHGRPLLLHVGFASAPGPADAAFRDPALGALAGEHFVPVLVDRQDHPEVDARLQAAVQAITGRGGGWPATLVATPDGRPFLGGADFPLEARPGRPSLRDLLERSVALWTGDRARVSTVADAVAEAVSEADETPTARSGISAVPLDRFAEAAAEAADARWGGFDGPPRFPPHGPLEALVAHHVRTGAPRSLRLVTRTLDGMARGGLHDWIAGGFARHTRDAAWAVPQFEKLLPDQAQLAARYVDGWRLTGRPLFARVARDTLDFVARELTGPEGAFLAGLSAESGGHPGGDRLWTRAAVVDGLAPADGPRAADLLGLTAEAPGPAVVRLDTPLDALGPDDRRRVEDALFVLDRLRRDRPAPAVDPQRIVAWNGLMIEAFASAGAAFREQPYVERATTAALVLLRHAVVDGRLHRTWQDGVARHPALLDDHAFLADALVTLWEVTLDPRWLHAAVDLTERALDLFDDDDDDLAAVVGRDVRGPGPVLRRPWGGAEPSPQGALARVLTRLAALTGRDAWGARADRLLGALVALQRRHPRAIDRDAVTAAMRADGLATVAIVGPDVHRPVEPLLRVVHDRVDPFRVVAGTRDGGVDFVEVPWLATAPADPARPVASVCRDGTCLPPTPDAEVLAAQLDAPRASRRRPGAGRVRAPALPTDPAAWLGTPVDLAAGRGQVVVIDFWTAGCVNCQHVLPVLDAIEDRFAGQPVTVLGVHSAKFDRERQREAVAAALSRHGVRHPVLLDPDHAVWSAYAVKGWPTLIVLDPNGRIAWRHPGEVDVDTLATVIADLLEDHAADLVAAPAVPSTAPPEPGVLAAPAGVAVAPDGTAWIADTGHHRLLQLALEGVAGEGPVEATILRVLGDGHPGLDDGAVPRFRRPHGLSAGPDALWIADTGNHAVRRLDLARGTVETVAGCGALGRGEAGDARAPRGLALRSPWDVHAEGDAVFVAMAGAHQVWVLLPERPVFGPFLGSGAEDLKDGPALEAALAQPSGVVRAGPLLFWVDAESSAVRVAHLQHRVVTTIVGAGLFDHGDVDGPGPEVRLQHPQGLALADGALWVADTYNGAVKRIAWEHGTTTTLARGLDQPAALAPLEPHHLLVADQATHGLHVVDRRTGRQRRVRFTTESQRTRRMHGEVDEG